MTDITKELAALGALHEMVSYFREDSNRDSAIAIVRAKLTELAAGIKQRDVAMMELAQIAYWTECPLETDEGECKILDGRCEIIKNCHACISARKEWAMEKAREK